MAVSAPTISERNPVTCQASDANVPEHSPPSMPSTQRLLPEDMTYPPIHMSSTPPVASRIAGTVQVVSYQTW